MELLYLLFPLQIFTIALVLKTYSIFKKNSMCEEKNISSHHEMEDK